MSLQLESYLRERASGATITEASARSGIPLAEAKLTEKAIESGEVEMPRAGAGTRAHEGQPREENDNMAEGIVAGDQLRLFIERIERLHEERQGIADDIKDVFADAKAQGFDTWAMKAVMKLRKLETHTLQEREAILACYVEALGMTPIEQAIALAA